MDPTPCTFTSITPAWNNDNLGRLACKITSPLVFAHVRAAYPGMPVSEQNCHPFQVSATMITMSLFLNQTKFLPCLQWTIDMRGKHACIAISFVICACHT